MNAGRWAMLIAAGVFTLALASARAIPAQGDATGTSRDIIPGDMNDDGVVDVLDFPLFVDCMHGPEVPEVSPPCARGHFDLDPDIDLHDVAGFQEAFMAVP